MLYAFQGVEIGVPERGSNDTAASGDSDNEHDHMSESDNEVLINKHLLTQIFYLLL